MKEEVLAGLIVMLRPAVAVRELALVTCAVKLAEPVAEGVPEITPVLESVSPAGRLPETIDHIYGVVPPVAVNVAL